MSFRLGLVRFIARYAAWNGLFGSGVAALSAKIGRSTDLFLEEGFPRPLADRSVLVGSYFFDAARDEFDDRDTEHRDTHRCLAQACLIGLIELSKADNPRLGKAEFLEKALAHPMWLTALRGRVASGYGNGSSDNRANIFRAIGYHLGSELLADQEFSMIDATMRDKEPALVDTLKNHHVSIAGREHSSYQWIRLHAGGDEGGGAEADHFAWAMEGVERAFTFTPSALRSAARHQLELGYQEFARDHEEFFDHVLVD